MRPRCQKITSLVTQNPPISTAPPRDSSKLLHLNVNKKLRTFFNVICLGGCWTVPTQFLVDSKWKPQVAWSWLMTITCSRLHETHSCFVYYLLKTSQTHSVKTAIAIELLHRISDLIHVKQCQINTIPNDFKKLSGTNIFWILCPNLDPSYHGITSL